MKGKSNKRIFRFFLLFFAGILLQSCIPLSKPAGVLNYYENPKISSYKVEKIALLPLLPDDTTNYGAYFSTNHLYNFLDENYPSLELADIDWVREFDCSFVDKQIDAINTTKRFDIEDFYISEPGYDLIEDGYDAVLIGTIDSLQNSHGIYLGIYENSFPVRGWITSCKFTYYLVSLIDGRILWKATVSGEEVCKMENYFIKEFPPLDYAITNGIDRMVDVLPEEIFK